jgi:hypothetical protein
VDAGAITPEEPPRWLAFTYRHRMSVETVVGVVAAFGVLAGVVYSGVQTLLLRRQTEIANKVAATSEARATIQHLHEVLDRVRARGTGGRVSFPADQLVLQPHGPALRCMRARAWCRDRARSAYYSKSVGARLPRTGIATASNTRRCQVSVRTPRSRVSNRTRLQARLRRSRPRRWRVLHPWHVAVQTLTCGSGTLG